LNLTSSPFINNNVTSTNKRRIETQNEINTVSSNQQHEDPVTSLFPTCVKNTISKFENLSAQLQKQLTSNAELISKLTLENQMISMQLKKLDKAKLVFQEFKTDVVPQPSLNTNTNSNSNANSNNPNSMPARVIANNNNSNSAQNNMDYNIYPSNFMPSSSPVNQFGLFKPLPLNWNGSNSDELNYLPNPSGMNINN